MALDDGSTYEVDVPVYASLEEQQAARDAMAAKAGERDIGFHGNASVNDGMPPGQCAVLSPMELKVAAEAGGIALVEMPMGMLRTALETFHGPSKEMDLKAGYSQAAQPAAENVASMTLNTGLKLDALEPTPPTGST